MRPDWVDLKSGRTDGPRGKVLFGVGVGTGRRPSELRQSAGDTAREALRAELERLSVQLAGPRVVSLLGTGSVRADRFRRHLVWDGIRAAAEPEFWFEATTLHARVELKLDRLLEVIGKQTENELAVQWIDRLETAFEAKE